VNLKFEIYPAFDIPLLPFKGGIDWEHGLNSLPTGREGLRGMSNSGTGFPTAEFPLNF
jgi:hypothetical protein